MALRFAQEGAAVALGDVDDPRMEGSASLVRERGGRVLLQHCDVSRRADVDALVPATVAQFGRLDIAVANAGVVEQETDGLRMTEPQWDRTIDVNLKGVRFSPATKRAPSTVQSCSPTAASPAECTARQPRG